MSYTLTTFIRQALMDVGYGWEAGKTPTTSPYTWQRPPLTTEEVLLGIPLQQFLKIPVRLDIDELADIYEQFVAGAVRQRTLHRRRGAHHWLCRQLDMKAAAFRTLFVPLEFNAERLGLHLTLMQFAALVAYNVPCHIEQGPDTFAAVSEVEGYQFGVRNGQLVTNMPGLRPTIPVRGLYVADGNLQDIARGAAEMSETINLYDVTRHWLDLRAGDLGLDYEPFQLALSVSWWRTGGIFPELLWELTLRERSRQSLERALDEARAYDNYEAPLEVLRDIFVPQFITAQMFKRRFGNPESPVRMPLSAFTRRRWDEAIDELTPLPETEV
jgi:hypothetical protein